MCCHHGISVPLLLHLVQGTSRRFGFVLFNDPADAEEAMRTVDGAVLKASWVLGGCSRGW